MSYLTIEQLADGPEARKELAELYALDVALLSATLDGEDRSAWDADEQAAADEAVASIGRFIAQADGEVDARLAVRGYPLPMSAVQFPVLTVWARAIVRYHLNRNRDRTDEERGRIERDYRDALRALDYVAQGKLSLGAGDPLVGTDPADGGAVRIASNPRMFTRKGLGAL